MTRFHPRGAGDGGQASITADDTVAVLDALAAQRGAPGPVRCDNGSELTAHAPHDWCRFSKAQTAVIEPGAPWQNPFVESFNGPVRDELLDIEQFSCLAEAGVVISDWREDYSHQLPQCSLGEESRGRVTVAPGPSTHSHR